MAEEQRFVLGIAYQAGPDPRITKGVDGGRDYFTKEELEKACWSYMRNGPRMNAFHVEGTEDCAEPVESFIWRWDDWDAGDGIVVKDGDWLLGSILSPRMWDAKKAGRVNGYSPEGTARRRRVAKEDAVPIAKGASALDGEDDELTPLSDASMTKVALVGAGANGIPRFLISKEADATGLLEPEFVRDLIAKAEPEPSAEEDTGQVTMTGSPAAIAAFIHKASVRQAEGEPEPVAKAKYSADQIKTMGGKGHAFKKPGGGYSYPIGDTEDLGNAIHAVGRGGADHDAIRRYVIGRAKALGASGKIPGNWAADGSLKEGSVSKEATVTKAGMGPELDDGIDQLDPTVPLCAPEGDAPGDPTDPGSPAWEAIDAATATKWCSILSRSKVAVGLLAEREMLEAASADPDDACNAMDLEDACCAIDYAISLLAPFAVAEQSEADCGEADMMAMVGKAAGEGEPALHDLGAELQAIRKAMDADLSGPLTVLETFGTIVRKSGRVLSAVNEAHIREAHQRLNTVLSSLPSAPVADDGQPVAKTANEEADMPQPAPSAEATAASGQQPAMGTAEPPLAAQEAVVTKTAGDGQDAPREAAEPVRKSALALVYDADRRLAGVVNADAILTQVAKADGDGEKKAMQAVFDQDGDLIGIVDPDAIQPVTGAGGKAPAGDSDAAPAADAPADDGDMTPQPPADAGTPAGAADDDGTVAKQDGTITVTHDVLKSIAETAARTALEAQGAAHQEVVAKMAADKDEMAEKLSDVTARLETVEKQDARPGVFANGAVPPPGTLPPSRPSLRGQDQGAAPPIDVAKAAEMKRQMYTADPADANRIANEMQQAAIDQLAVIHRR